MLKNKIKKTIVLKPMLEKKIKSSLEQLSSNKEIVTKPVFFNRKKKKIFKIFKIL